MPYRILIPDELPYSSGVENVAVSIVRELLDQVESVTWAIEDQKRSVRIKNRLPNSKNLEIVPFRNWNTSGSKNKIFLPRLKAGLKKLPLLRKGAERIYRGLIDQRIVALAAETNATHCWLHFIQGQSVPNLDIPLCGLIHDQNFRYFPENLPKGKPRQFKSAIQQWLARADTLTVLSEVGRKELLEINPTPRSQIEIIPNAITPRQFRIEKRQPSGKPTILYPAAALSHKNHLCLFKAVKRLALKGHKFHLVLCGESTDKLIGIQKISNSGAEKARVFFNSNRKFLEDYIEALGHCEKETLENLYCLCTAVVLPSLYEGFGLPLVEALARSTRVICNRLIPFQEQVDRYDAHDWVDWFNGEDIDSIVEVLEPVLQSGDAPFNQSVFPCKKLQTWTWRNVAERYVQIFKEASHRKVQKNLK